MAKTPRLKVNDTESQKNGHSQTVIRIRSRLNSRFRKRFNKLFNSALRNKVPAASIKSGK